MKSKLRVLVVDDDRMMARTLRDILRVKGCDAEAVHSGPKALEKVKREAFEGRVTSVPEVLAASTGVQIRKLGGLGSFSTISIRVNDGISNCIVSYHSRIDIVTALY